MGGLAARTKKSVPVSRQIWESARLHKKVIYEDQGVKMPSE